MKEASLWSEHNPLSLSGVANQPCVYCVKIDGIVVYVGSTRRFRSRFYEHKFRYGYWKNIILPWCDISLGQELSVKIKKSVRYGDWAMDEIRLIRKLRPVFNVAHKNPRVTL